MANPQQQRKMTEGMEHIKEAEKCMKTSLFKWKPDLDGAASAYTKAATCFRNAKSFKEAKESYIKAADVQRQMNSPFHAAKSLEQAGLLCKEYKDVEDCVNLLERAADLFQQNGTPDTAALTLDKAAKAIELNYPSKAAELYLKACDISELEDKSRQCAEFCGKAGRLLVRAGKYEESIKALRREIEFHQETENIPMINRVILGIVMVHLDNGDPVEAERFYTNTVGGMECGFGDTEELVAAEQLLQAYNEGDETAANEVLTRPFVRYMDNCFAKIAKTMVIPGGIVAKSSNKNTADSANSDVTSKAQLDDDEDFDGGLC